MVVFSCSRNYQRHGMMSLITGELEMKKSRKKLIREREKKKPERDPKVFVMPKLAEGCVIFYRRLMKRKIMKINNIL